MSRYWFLGAYYTVLDQVKRREYISTLWLKFIIVSQLETYQSSTGIKLIIFFNKKVFFLKKEDLSFFHKLKFANPNLCNLKKA